MIVSASRRTDIPAYYGEWFLKRLHAGYSLVKNPFNPARISRVSLLPEDVEFIMFWSKNPQPFSEGFEVIRRRFPFALQYTLNHYGPDLEPAVPDWEVRIAWFRELAHRYGSAAVIWRYDPIILSNTITSEDHLEWFRKTARSLRGYTHRVHVSLMEPYRKTVRAFEKMSKFGWEVNVAPDPHVLGRLFDGLAAESLDNGIGFFSCSAPAGGPWAKVQPGRCIDPEYLQNHWGIASVPRGKDNSQRPHCGCCPSKDIGAYHTCPHGCVYCYAGTVHSARRFFAGFDPCSPGLGVAADLLHG